MRNHDPKLQEWCERVLSAAMKRGDKIGLSEGLGVTPAFISQQCNPADPYPSDFYKFMFFLREWTRTNAEGARAIAACIASSVEVWAGDQEAEDRAALAVLWLKESAEFGGTQVDGRRVPEQDQVKELMDAMSVGYRILAAPQRKGERVSIGIAPLQQRRKVG